MAAATSASSLHLLSLTSQTLSLSNNSPSPSLFTPLKPLPKLVLSLSSSPFAAKPVSKFARKVAELDELESLEDEQGLDFGEPNLSPEHKLFVGNLPFNVDSAALAGLFERAGNVEMVEVIYDKFTGRSRGFGFVTMSSLAEVEAAAQQFDGYELDGRPLRVNSGPPPPKKEGMSFRGARGGGGGGGGASFDNTNRVYVGNLSWGVDDLALQTLFSEQGKVKEAKVVYDRDSGRSRGFGFVTYSSAEEVNNAVESLDGADLDGRTIRVSPAEARPRRQF